MMEYDDCLIAYNFTNLFLIFFLTLFMTVLSVLMIYTTKNRLRLVVITTPKECVKMCKRIERDCLDLSAVGFDAEWVNDCGRVALVQICTANRICGLFRLNVLKTVPDCLRKILENEKIIKLGVGTMNDTQRLRRDYGVDVRGTLDLRNLYHTQFGLSRMSLDILGFTLDKNMQCSNWEAKKLTTRQLDYAAVDALVGIEIFKQWLEESYGNGGYIWESVIDYITAYLDKKPAAPAKVEKKVRQKPRKPANKNACAKGEIYAQCLMLAPDNTLLCTCSRQKAEWYVKHERAELMSEDPYTIRLLFEPNKKPTGAMLLFQTELKQNQCVVCGVTSDLSKYWVIPRFISKQFPDEMKSHCSHDVVVLCLNCHQKSSIERTAFVNSLEPSFVGRANNPHMGKTFIKNFMKDGKTIHDMQRQFRQNFVIQMEPRFLPTNWSIEHVNE